jgi:hypothetical protein
LIRQLKSLGFKDRQLECIESASVEIAKKVLAIAKAIIS